MFQESIPILEKDEVSKKLIEYFRKEVGEGLVGRIAFSRLRLLLGMSYASKEEDVVKFRRALLEAIESILRKPVPEDLKKEVYSYAQ